MWATWIEALVKTILLIACLTGVTAYLVLWERRGAAWIRDRPGPDRAGIPLTKIAGFARGRPTATELKSLFEEEITPGRTERWLDALAPVISFTAAMLVFAVIPFGTLDLGFEPLRAVDLVVAPGLHVGVVYLLAVGGIAVYGLLPGGWTGRHGEHPAGGWHRSVRRLSCQIPLGLAILGVVLMSRSPGLERIVAEQARSGVWNVFVQPLGFFVFAVAAFAEPGRLPFDPPGSEADSAGGYRRGDSGVKLTLYLVGEHLQRIAAAVLIVLLFLGGWHLWGLPDGGEVFVRGELVRGAWWPVAILRALVLLAKVLGVIVLLMLARRSWPRFGSDRLTEMAWKRMLPLGLVNLVVVAAWIEIETARRPANLAPAMAACGWAVLVAAWLVLTWRVPGSRVARPPAEPGETP